MQLSQIAYLLNCSGLIAPEYAISIKGNWPTDNKQLFCRDIALI